MPCTYYQNNAKGFSHKLQEMQEMLLEKFLVLKIFCFSCSLWPKIFCPSLFFVALPNEGNPTGEFGFIRNVPCRIGLRVRHHQCEIRYGSSRQRVQTTSLKDCPSEVRACLLSDNRCDLCRATICRSGGESFGRRMLARSRIDPMPSHAIVFARRILPAATDPSSGRS